MSPWGTLDDASTHDHPKMIHLTTLLSPLAALAADGLWRRGIVYSNRTLSDGYLPRRIIPVLAGLPAKAAFRLADALVRATGPNSPSGLFESTEGGYIVHDFLQYNQSRKEVERLREVKASSGRTGGLRSGEARRKQTRSTPEANREANTKQLLHVRLNSPSPSYNPPTPHEQTKQSAAASTTARPGRPGVDYPDEHGYLDLPDRPSERQP